MIPHIIHYCWFGRGEIPQLAKECILSWQRYMPEYTFKLWNEDNFDIESNEYVSEAYKAGKFAFVSDYVRLWALKNEGGLYFDVDFEVYKSFDDLLDSNVAFAGYEGSKYSPVMMGVCASEPDGEWVTAMLDSYADRHFLLSPGKYDLTPNVTFLTNLMKDKGLVCDGVEKIFMNMHIYPVDYFCPHLTTGEYVRSENTFCEHKNLGSWSKSGWRTCLLLFLPSKIRPALIKLKRSIWG